MDQYYKVLGLSCGATAEEIREAFRGLAKLWHPDRFAQDPALQKHAESRMVEINEAYRALCAYQRVSTGATNGDRPPVERPRKGRDDNYAWLLFSRESTWLSPAVFEVEVPRQSCLMKRNCGQLWKDGPARSDTWAVRVRPGEVAVNVRARAAFPPGLPGERAFTLTVGRYENGKFLIKFHFLNQIALVRVTG